VGPHPRGKGGKEKKRVSFILPDGSLRENRTLLEKTGSGEPEFGILIWEEDEERNIQSYVA